MQCCSVLQVASYKEAPANMVPPQQISTLYVWSQKSDWMHKCSTVVQDVSCRMDCKFYKTSYLHAQIQYLVQVFGAHQNSPDESKKLKEQL